MATIQNFMAIPPEKRRRQTALPGSGSKSDSRHPSQEYELDKDEGPVSPGRSDPKRRKTAGSQDAKQVYRKSRSKGTGLHSFFNLKTLSQVVSDPASRTNAQQRHNHSSVSEIDDDRIEEEHVYEPSHASVETTSSIPTHNISSSARRLSNDGSYQAVPPVESFLHSTPWSDLFPPTSIEELVVNKMKVLETKRWLEEAASGHPLRKLLILKGPAGCGKSVTIELLGTLVSLKVLTWRNPEQAVYGEENYISMANQLRDFLSRGNNFTSLELSNTTSEQESSKSPEYRSSVFVIEEFPVSTISAESLLTALRDIIFLHLHGVSIVPIIMIFSEDETNSASVTELLTAYQILGPEILHHPAVATINFNKVAPTFMTKALDIVLRKASQGSVLKSKPSRQVLKELSMGGDLRCSIGLLQMICTSDGCEMNQYNPRAASHSPSYHKDQSLGFFHAMAKILYNKREDSSTADPPEYLAPRRRAFTSTVDVEELSRLMSNETEFFVAGLHENYVPSCVAIDSLEVLEAASAELSCADILASQGSRGVEYASSRATKGLSSVDVVRHSEMVLHTVARGLLFSLPHPVTRKIREPSQASHKISYPYWFRYQKIVSETRNRLSKMLLHSTSESSMSLATVEPQGRRARRQREQSIPAISSSYAPSVAQQAASNSNFKDLVLVYVPYLEMLSALPIRTSKLASTAESPHARTPEVTTGRSQSNGEDVAKVVVNAEHEHMTTPQKDLRTCELSDDEIVD